MKKIISFIISSAFSLSVNATTLFHNYHRISTADRIEITSFSNEVSFTDSGVLVLSNDARTVRGNALDVHGNSRGAGILFKYLRPTNGFNEAADPINIGLRLSFSSTCNSMFIMWRLSDPGTLTDSNGEEGGVYIQVRKSDAVDSEGQCYGPVYHNIHPTGSLIPVPSSALDNKLHSLTADLVDEPEGGHRLRVRADGVLIFNDLIETDSSLLDLNGDWLEGASGFRSDNGVFHIGVFDRFHVN